MRGPARLLIASAVVWGALSFGQRSLAASTGDSGSAPPSLALYGQLPSLEDPTISPAGDRLAYLVRQGDQRYVAITDLTTGKLATATRVTETKVRGLLWYDDSRLLIVYSATSYPPFDTVGHRDEWSMLAAWDVTKNQVESIKMHDDNYETMNVVTGLLQVRMVKDHPELFVSGAYLEQSNYRPGLFRVDLGRDETKLVAGGGTSGADWAVDAQGRVAASFDYHMNGAKEGQWLLRIRHGDDMRQVAAGDAPIDPPSIVGFSYDDKALLVAFDTPDGWIWKPLSLAGDTWGAPLAAGKTFYDVIRNRLTGQVIGGVQDPLQPQQVFFDPTLQSRWSAIMGAYSGERVELDSYSDDFSKFLIRVFGPRDGDRYVLIDWRTGDSSPIGDAYHGLSLYARVKPVSYKAADGLPIAGFVTLPPGRPAKNLSLIVMPHGGPAATDDGDFDWWAQALASRGYAVLQVNFRGSDTTAALLSAGFGQWGRKMQTDLSDGALYLVQQGIADPKRICIVGGSYGGYAALAGVTLQTGIYRCAVSVAGVADLPEFLRWTNNRMSATHNAFTQYWDRFLGVSGPDDPALRAISPIDHVAAVTVPVLLIHGRDDTVVPYAQSAQMAKALERAGKSVQMVTLPHEDHFLSHSETREQMLEAVVSFLQRNDPPAG